MKKIFGTFRLFAVFTMLIVLASCGGSKQALNYNYEIAPIGVGVDGTKVFKVYSYGKTADAAIAQGKKDALHAAIFRGITGGRGVAPTPAILADPSAETTHAEFFKEFFKEGGRYLQYVNLTTDGVPSGQDRLKVAGGYKVGLSVQILYNKLRKDLETQGIARGLSTGF